MKHSNINWKKLRITKQMSLIFRIYFIKIGQDIRFSIFLSCINARRALFQMQWQSCVLGDGFLLSCFEICHVTSRTPSEKYDQKLLFHDQAVISVTEQDNHFKIQFSYKIEVLWIQTIKIWNFVWKGIKKYLGNHCC